MNNIKILDEMLINKIAAGEVIERPASIVKELIENSLDANSTQIDIYLENYGKKLIRISDNGEGMLAEDAKNSVLRHATSKIKNENDLFNIKTLGFRGEALASIAAISQLSLRTKKPQSLEGFKINLEGGRIISSNTSSSSPGTTIEVRNIFYNTPARLKFLKTDSNELQHIIDIVIRYCLIHPKKSFRLFHNNKNLINSPPNLDFINNIVSIYGTETAKQLMNIQYQDEYLQIEGYISKPSLLKSDKTYQSTYVNKRYVKDETVTKAIYDAYHTLLFVNKNPITILNITINPNQIDVNVHPTKEKIKFEQAEKVYESIFNALRKTLLENNLITDYSDLNSSEQIKFNNTQKIEKPKEKNYYTPEKQNILETNVKLTETSNIQQNPIPTKKLPEMKILGQILKSFFIAETEKGFLIIDQHAVHERINYEKFMAEYLNKNIKIQNLLNPILINFPPKETLFLKNNLNKIKNFGFDIEHFGDNTFKLITVPTILNKIENKESFNNLITELSNETDFTFEKKQEIIITRMACRSSIKAGDEISIPQMEKLLNQLDNCNQPYTCPHGRPIFINLTLNDLEKMFRRK